MCRQKKNSSVHYRSIRVKRRATLYLAYISFYGPDCGNILLHWFVSCEAVRSRYCLFAVFCQHWCCLCWVFGCHQCLVYYLHIWNPFGTSSDDVAAYLAFQHSARLMLYSILSNEIQGWEEIWRACIKGKKSVKYHS